jgi:hypothetical protein
MVSKLSNLLPFRWSSILGSKNNTVQGQENMEVAACVGFCFWLRNVAHAETSALVLSGGGGFAYPLTTIFLVICGILHHEDAAKLVRGIPYLLFNPPE